MVCSMKSKPQKVVLDTNIYISGIFWEGLPRKLLESARKGTYRVFTTEPIMAELREKMIDKLKLTPKDADFYIDGLKTFVEIVKPSKTVSVIKEDPDDDKFIDCALEVEADFIVSGDHHLLDLREYQGVKILNAREFLT